MDVVLVKLYELGTELILGVSQELILQKISNPFQKEKIKDDEVKYVVQLPKEANILTIKDICEKSAESSFDSVAIGEKAFDEKRDEKNQSGRPVVKEWYAEEDYVHEFFDKLRAIQYNQSMREKDMKGVRWNRAVVLFVDKNTKKIQKLLFQKKFKENSITFITHKDDLRGKFLIQDIAKCFGAKYTVQEGKNKNYEYQENRFGANDSYDVKRACQMDIILDNNVSFDKKIPIPYRNDWRVDKTQGDLQVVSTPLSIDFGLENRIELQCPDHFIQDSSLTCELRLLFENGIYQGAQLIACVENLYGIEEKLLFLSEYDQNLIETSLEQLIVYAENRCIQKLSMFEKEIERE